MTDATQRRTVTMALAGMDFFFTVGTNKSDGATVWHLSFTEEGDEQRPIVMMIRDGWLLVIYNAAHLASADHCQKLLKLNGQLLLARVALDAAGNAMVFSEVNMNRFNADDLKDAIGAVLEGARGVSLLNRTGELPRPKTTKATKGTKSQKAARRGQH